MVEITAVEQNKEKGIKMKEDNIRGIWENIKCTTIHSVGVPEGEREREPKKFYLKRW